MSATECHRELGDLSDKPARRESEIAEEVRAARDAGVVGGANPMGQLRAALAELDAIGSANSELRAEVHLALAWFEAMVNGPRSARELMDQALALSPDLKWRVDLQWAGMLVDENDRHQEALELFDAVIPLLDQDRNLVIALNNRGVLHNTMGRVVEAERDALAAAELAESLGLIDFQSAALHNLGIAFHYAGDLPLALFHMKRARLDGARVADGAREVDRGRVLYDAGLMSEAAEAAETAVLLAAQSQWTNDLALAHVLGARANAALGDFRIALSHARRAAEVFQRRGAHSAAAGARLVELRIRLALLGLSAGPKERMAAVLANRAEELIPTFIEIDANWEAAGARITVAAARQLAGDWSGAAAMEAGIGSLIGAPLPLRLDLQWVRARARIETADHHGALDEIGQGLDELSQFQSRLGSQDLQASTSTHGVFLADLALAVALHLGDPALLLEWIERTRAVTSKLPTVRPPADPALAASLAEFRAISGGLRQLMSEGRTNVAAKEQADQLRKEIRSLAWQGSGIAASSTHISLEEIRDSLALARDIAVEYLSFQGQLHAVVVHHGGVEHLALGEETSVIEMMRRLNADLDLLALRRVPDSIRFAAMTSREHLAAELGRRLVAPVDRWYTGGVVSIAAVGELAGLAWSILPEMHGRPIRVNSSLAAAVHAVAKVPTYGPNRVLMVWGPDVPHAISEWETLSALYPSAQLLAGAEATPAAVVETISRNDLVHFATHGNHEPENPLFSGLELHGGPLLAYDLAPVSLPQRVVLSACEVGRNTERPGGEPLGLATVLLRSGVATVIAATSRIADDEAARTLSAFHLRLAAGASAPVALAAALLEGGNTVPLTCFGA